MKLSAPMIMGAVFTGAAWVVANSSALSNCATSLGLPAEASSLISGAVAVAGFVLALRAEWPFGKSSPSTGATPTNDPGKPTA